MIVNEIFYCQLEQHVKRKRAEQSLYEFMRQAWHVIEPATQFVEGWHLEEIALHLEAVTTGKIRKLIINIPPRHCKTILVCVMWPCWVWATQPSKRWMFGSYGMGLSLDASMLCRNILESEWYKSNWGDKFGIMHDQNAKHYFLNDKSGGRFASSTDGVTTGKGGDFLVADDPINAKEGASEAALINCIKWWDQGMATRFNNPKKGCKVIVMQRVGEKDLTGHVLKNQTGWTHLFLPAEFEPDRKCVTSIGGDRRTKAGELLWKELYGPDEIAELKQSLGEYGTAGQLQQRPAPAEGGIIKRDWFKMLKIDEPLPTLLFVVQSYDTAFTEKTTNDPTAHTAWGVFSTKEGKRVILLDAWTEHMGYPELRKKMYDEYKSKYGDQEKGVDVVLIEDKGSGISLAQDLRRAMIPVRTYNPGKADKTTRVHSIAPLIEAGLVYIPESKKSPGQFPAWANVLINQLITFPNAERDDLCDTASQVLIYLRDAGMITLDQNKFVEGYEYPKKRVNPYAM